MQKTEWLTEKEVDSLCSNIHALLLNDGLTAFLRVDALTALQTDRAEAVVERLDTGEPVFRITCRKELRNWVKHFDIALHDFKAEANKQTALDLKGGRK